MKKVIADLEDVILKEPSLDVALELAHAYGNLLWFADIGIYDASPLEQALISRCASSFDPPGLDIGVAETGTVIHVVTEPYVTGGHTRLMERLARMHEAPVDLLITKGGSIAAVERVSAYFEKVIQVSALTANSKVSEIAHVLSRYEKVILHIHPDDVYSVIACGLVAGVGRKIFFVNHADHVFSFGCSVADYYFELSSYGRRLDELKVLKGKKSFLGIPIDIPEALWHSECEPSRDEKLRFVTAGSDIKFKPVKELSITPLLHKVLRDYPESTVCVIGSSLRTAYWWWFLKLKYKNRFSVVSTMPYAEYSMEVSRADFFIDSHPIPGGTAFAEQFIAGRRCVGLVSPLQGYSPADLLKRVSPDEVMTSIASYKYPQRVFEMIRDVHSTVNVKSRYIRCIEDGITSPNLLDTYCEWSGDVGMFRQTRSSLSVDVSVSTFLILRKLNAQIAIRLFVSLSFKKQLKLGLKLAMNKLRVFVSSPTDAK
ncbi:hypothetical protein ABQX22_08460 [Xanthomonas sp. WHRI 1810A]|uniref:hypothetical protein n=1 Tax=Xanthomonas sp. WHRI 1810A TaxID=3161565 RepID=UPI0032E88612